MSTSVKPLEQAAAGESSAEEVAALTAHLAELEAALQVQAASSPAVETSSTAAAAAASPPAPAAGQKDSKEKPAAVQRRSSASSLDTKEKNGKKKRAAAAVAEPEAVAVETPRELTYRQGQRCVCGKQQHRGVIQFVGAIASLGPGVWVGVQLDEAVGTSDGHVDRRMLFQCPAKHGSFHRVADVIIDAPSPEQRSSPSQPPPQPPARQPTTLLRQQTSLGSTSTDDGLEAVDRPVVPSVVLPAAPLQCVAAGRGLQTAVVHQLSQFVITAYDEAGRRAKTGGEPFSVFVRELHPPGKLRVKLHDHGDGHYTGEYKAEVSGEIEVTISLRGEPLPGSPFAVSAVTLQAQPLRCVLRGEALHAAVARKPMQFECDFVDALGNPAMAEELDVRVEMIAALQVRPPRLPRMASPASLVAHTCLSSSWPTLNSTPTQYALASLSRLLPRTPSSLPLAVSCSRRRRTR